MTGAPFLSHDSRGFGFPVALHKKYAFRPGKTVTSIGSTRKDGPYVAEIKDTRIMKYKGMKNKGQYSKRGKK